MLDNVSVLELGSSKNMLHKAYTDVKVTSKTGMVALCYDAQQDAFDSKPEFNAYDNRMCYFCPNEPESEIKLSQTFGGDMKKYHRGVRAKVKFIEELFSEALLCPALSTNVDSIVTYNNRQETFVPLALGQVGVYANFWCSRTTAQKDCSPIAKTPVGCIFSGMCMMGDTVKGIDQHGVEHPLTNPKYCMPEGPIITKILLKSKDLCPYERITLASLESLAPFFQSLGNGNTPRFHFVIPLAEYIIYGIQLLLTRKITLSAFGSYVEILQTHAHFVKERLSTLCTSFGTTLDTEGPLDDLLGSHRFQLEAFAEKLGITTLQIISGTVSDQLVVEKCLSWLAQFSPYQEIWSHIRETWSGFAKSNDKNKGGLLSINYLSYLVKMAAASQETPPGTQACFAAPFNEKPLGLAYRELLAKKFGPMLVFNWMTPVVSNISHQNNLLRLETTPHELKQLLDLDIVPACFQEIAIAVNSKCEKLLDCNGNEESQKIRLVKHFSS